MNKKVYVTRKIPELGIHMLKNAGFEVDINTKDRPLTQKELIKVLKKKPYDAVLSLLTDKIDAKVFDAAPQAKIFANYAVGFNNFDVTEAQKRGIYLTNTPGGGTETVAEHVFGMILALSRRVVEGDLYVKKGKYKGWDPLLLPGIDLKGKKFGAIGTGKVGNDAVTIAVRGFGMKAMYYDVKSNAHLEGEFGIKCSESVEEVLKEADIVSIHVPLLDSTHHLINEERLKLMKPSAYLINCARGPIVDEQALVKALKNKWIKGAGLDVFEFEPKLASGLTKLPNVVLTPHIASSTHESRDLMARLAAQNIIDALAGMKPTNLVY